METDRIPEAALFARTYAPSKVPQAVKAWRKDLEAKKKPKLAAAVGDPDDTPEAFEEGWEAALAREQEATSGRGKVAPAPFPVPSSAFEGLENGLDNLKIGGQTISPPPFVNGSVPGKLAAQSRRGRRLTLRIGSGTARKRHGGLCAFAAGWRGRRGGSSRCLSALHAGRRRLSRHGRFRFIEVVPSPAALTCLNGVRLSRAQGGCAQHNSAQSIVFHTLVFASVHEAAA